MATRKPSDTKHDDPLPGESGMARLYHAAAKDVPTAALDIKILAEARHAVARPKARGLFGGHWAIPFSTAAVIVLSVGVLLLLSQQGILNHRDELAPLYSEAPSQPPARREPVAPRASSGPALPAAQAPAKTKPLLAEVAQGVAVPSTTPSPAPEAKKSEQAAATTEPMQRARIAEERDIAMRDDFRTQEKLAKETSVMNAQADVIAVQVTGQPDAYQFSVGIRSPDKGCAQYADWWEVVSKDGKLLYRRVLLHSHVDEQPFTRAGGPVPIQPDTVVWVRAHMNTVGYGGIAFMGSPKTGFIQAMPAAGFAADLAKQSPLPDGCDF